MATYGCEMWKMKKMDENRTKAFKMKVLQQISRLSWREIINQ